MAMTRAYLLVPALLLASCHRASPVLSVDGLAHDPQRLYALRRRCAVAREQVGRARCRTVDAAYRRRFFLGLGGAHEFQTLSELPPIPSTFDGPDDGEGK